PERREAGEAEAGEEHETVVQRERETRQSRRHVDQSGDARAVEETGDGRREKEDSLPPKPPRAAERDTESSKRKQDRPGIAERHPGSVAALRGDRALAVDAVREGQEVGQETRERRRQRDGLAARTRTARGERGSPGPVLRGVRDRLEQRKELRAREQNR